MRPIVAETMSPLSRSPGVGDDGEGGCKRVESRVGPRERGAEVVAALLTLERKRKKKDELYKTPEEEYTRRLSVRLHPSGIRPTEW